MTPAPVHLEFLQDCVQLTPAPGERVTRIITCGFGAGDKFYRAAISVRGVKWECELNVRFFCGLVLCLDWRIVSDPASIDCPCGPRGDERLGEAAGKVAPLVVG